MAVNLFMSAKDTADYINGKLQNSDYSWLDVIFLSIKGLFPAFNYVRYVGVANNKFHRNLYKIAGVKGLYEELYPFMLDELADDFVNDRNIFSEEESKKGGFSIISYLNADPLYELNFDTRIILLNKGVNENGYTYRFYSISAQFSELEQNGIFNGIVQSPFIKQLQELRLPTPNLLEPELKRFFLFKDGIHPYSLESIEMYFFDSLFFDIYHPLQLSYEIYDEHVDIFNEENFDDVFLFYRPHIDKYILEKSKVKGNEYINTLTDLNTGLSIGGDSSNLSLDGSLYLIAEILRATKSNAKKWTQSAIIDEILSKRQELNEKTNGLEKRMIEEYFSQANKRLKLD